MVLIKNICRFLEAFAPVRLAEEWDNVGLLVGDERAEVSRVMTCLTVTPDSAQEAVDRGVQLIVTHHPLPFRPLKRLTTRDTTGRMLWQLIQAGVSIYSPHTAFDSAAEGINQRLAEGLGLGDIVPLAPIDNDPDELGAGRRGRITTTRICEFADHVKSFLNIEGLHIVGHPDTEVRHVAVACGSAGQFLQPALEAGCDLLVTGETTFHTCLEAEARGIALVLPGHYASERFALEQLAEVLAEEFADLEIWVSKHECDPLKWL